MLLAIESCVPDASLALLDRETGEIAWEATFTSQRAHNAVIFDPLREALDRCGRSLELIIVGRGPGSYGGVRVGIAVANGLSLALGATVLGLSSLEAMETEARTYAVVGDARRQSFFLARVAEGRLVDEPELLERDILEERLERLRQESIPVLTPDPGIAETFGNVRSSRPCASGLARRAAELDEREWVALASQPLEPHYLRAPYITTPKT